jgi:hypothetical protein
MGSRQQGASHFPRPSLTDPLFDDDHSDGLLAFPGAAQEPRARACCMPSPQCQRRAGRIGAARSAVAARCPAPAGANSHSDFQHSDDEETHHIHDTPLLGSGVAGSSYSDGPGRAWLRSVWSVSRRPSRACRAPNRASVHGPARR